jgi:hypothetical protein
MVLYFSKHNGTVTNSLKQYFETLWDGDYTVEVKKAKKIRSPLQNARYRVILNLLVAQDTGYTDDDWHELLKNKFIKPRIVKSKLDGRKRIKRKPTTTTLTTEEFQVYNQSILDFARDFFGVDFNQYLQ